MRYSRKDIERFINRNFKHYRIVDVDLYSNSGISVKVIAVNRHHGVFHFEFFDDPDIGIEVKLMMIPKEPTMVRFDEERWVSI